MPEPSRRKPRMAPPGFVERLGEYRLIEETLPRLMVLSEALDSDVLDAAVIVLQREHMAIQMLWAGHL